MAAIPVRGDVSIRELNRRFEWRLPDEEAATIAGLLLFETRCIPAVGQRFRFHGLEFEVLRRHRNQITRLRIGEITEDEQVREAQALNDPISQSDR